MGEKRAFTATNSEVSMMFWMIGLILIIKTIIDLFDMHNQVVAKNPGLALTFMVIIFFIGMATFFSFLAMAIPNYQISKNNLNILIDRITNPDYIGWIRFTRTKRLQFQLVKNGPLGQTKGMANGEKADVINDGSYTVITPCGNQAILVSDLLSHNINLERAVGWSLIHKHFGFLGFRAWEKAIEQGKILFKALRGKDKQVDSKAEVADVEAVKS